MSALEGLPGAAASGSGVRFTPPLEPRERALCTVPVEITVPVTKKMGGRRVLLRNDASGRRGGKRQRPERSSISLTCLPAL